MSATTTLPQLYSYGHELEMTDDKVGLLRDSSDAAEDFPELRRRVAEDGYLYLKGYLDRAEVLAARASLTAGLAAADVLDPAYPSIDGICKPGAGYVFKPELTNNNPAVQSLLYSGRLPEFYRQFYGEAIRHYDYTWLRAIGPGKGTNPHCDLPYMGRGTHGHMTCWVPYGEISFELGGLMVLEGSHKTCWRNMFTATLMPFAPTSRPKPKPRRPANGRSVARSRTTHRRCVINLGAAG